MIDKIYLGTFAIGRLDDWIFFSASNINGLFKINIESLEIEFVHHFKTLKMQDDNFWGWHGGKIIFDKDELFLFPLCSNVIINYNTKEQRECVINILDFPMNKFYVNEVIKDECEIIFKGDAYLPLYSLDLNKKTAQKSILGKQVFTKYESSHCSLTSYNRGSFCIVLQEKNEFLIVSKEMEQVIPYPAEIKERSVRDIVYIDEKIWFMFDDSSEIMCWDKELHSMKLYKNSEVKRNISAAYSKMFVFNGRICLIGNRCRGVYWINEEKDRIEAVVDKINAFQIIERERIGYPLFGNYCIYREELWIFPVAGKNLLIINKDMQIIRKKEFSIETFKIPEWDKQVNELRELEEKGAYTLNSYIKFILEK